MTRMMRAAIFKGNGILNVENVPVPEIRNPYDVLLQVKAASICGSDIHVLSVPPAQYAKPGIALGHEFVAEVVEVGSAVTTVRAGDIVVPDPIIKCGVCPDCRENRQNLCTHEDILGQKRDGGFAQYCVAPEKVLYKIPTDVPMRIAAQTEPLACVMNAVLKLNPQPGQRIVVFGAGAIGLTFIRVLRLYGISDLVVCETDENRQTGAKRCGADIVMNPSTNDMPAALNKLWGGLADIIIDAVGIGAVTQQAIGMLDATGRLLIFGQNNNAIAQIPPAQIVRKELSVLGSYSTHNSFPAAIRLLSNPDLGLERLISHELPLERISEGMAAVRNRTASRVIIYPNDENLV